MSVNSGLMPHYDGASCPAAGFNNIVGIASIDTGYYCGTPVTVKANGNGQFSWSVLSGLATINGAGNAISVVPNGNADILLEAEYGGSCNNLYNVTYYNNLDTVKIFSPLANLDAGTKDTFFFCGNNNYSLNATFASTVPWAPYTYAWTPSTTITAGVNSLAATAIPTAKTTYTITVTTPPSKGNCLWKDSVEIDVVAAKETSSFDADYSLGCTEDTVLFVNNTSTSFGPLTYKWSFGDSTTTSTQASPKHIYKKQGKYDVMLIANNGHCNDTIVRTLDVSHELKALFTVSRDSFCKGQRLHLDADTSIVSLPPARYHWDFGDNAQDTLKTTTFTYYNLVPQNVKLIITDTLGCKDSLTKNAHA
jgi:PKD repeat protein